MFCNPDLQGWTLSTREVANMWFSFTDANCLHLNLLIFQDESKSNRKSHKSKKHKEKDGVAGKKDMAKKKHRDAGELDSSSDVDKLEEFLGTNDAEVSNSTYEVF